MTASVDLESLVHLEQTFYDSGYTDGFEHGRVHGLIQGRALGREHGFEMWEEIGFYEGFASTWQAIYAGRAPRKDQRAVHHMTHLLDLIRQFPTVNPSGSPSRPESASDHAHASKADTIDLVKLQGQIRSRYKALCASLGVRPSLRARAGAGSDDGRGSADGAILRHLKRDVWTLDGDVKRPTVQGQGLSF